MVSLFFAPASAFNKKLSWIKAPQFKRPKLELQFLFLNMKSTQNTMSVKKQKVVGKFVILQAQPLKRSCLYHVECNPQVKVEWKPTCLPVYNTIAMKRPLDLWLQCSCNRITSIFRNTWLVLIQYVFRLSESQWEQILANSKMIGQPQKP